MPFASFGEMHLNEVLRSWENFQTFSYIATRGCGSSADKKISTNWGRIISGFPDAYSYCFQENTVLTEFNYTKTLKQLGFIDIIDIRL